MTDFWGSAVPTWIEAVGSVAAAAVGTIALILSLRNRGGVRTLADGLNAANEPERKSTTDEPNVIHLGDPDDVTPGETATPTQSAQEPVLWSVARDGRSFRLINRSRTQTVTLLEASDVSVDGDNAFQLLQALPVELAPLASIPFIIEKSIVSPAVTAVQIRWRQSDGLNHSQTLYI